MTSTQIARRLRGILAPVAVLRGNRDFGLLFSAQALSSLVDWLYIATLFVLAYRLTHSATMVALLTTTRLLPYALLLPVAGAISDRFDRKTVMAGANLGRALCMLALMTVHSRGALPIAFALVVVATLLSSLFRPALLASVPAVVAERQLVQANSLISQVDMVALGAGPALSGVILQIGSTNAAFLISAVALLMVASATVRLTVPRHASATESKSAGWLHYTLAGFHFLLHDNERVLLAVALTMTGLTLVGGAWWALALSLAENIYHLGDQGLGYLNGSYALAGILGGFLIAPALVRKGITPLFIVGAGASSAAVVMLGLSSSGGLAILVMAVIGVADVAAKVAAATIIQTATAHNMQGRVFAAFESALVFAMVAGSLIVGPVIADFGVRAADIGFGSAGLGLLAVSLPLLVKMEHSLGVRIFLHQVPALNALSLHLLDTLVERVQLERFAPANVIIRQGDEGDRFYIVKSGTVDVLTHGDDGQVMRVNTLSRMDYFGETALLRKVPRTATIRSQGAVELYSLSRSDFQELLRHSQEFEHVMRAESDARDTVRQNTLLLRV